MYKLIIAVAASAPLLLLTSGCTMRVVGLERPSCDVTAVGYYRTGCAVDTTVAVDRVVYNPGYSNDYVLSVGYYSNRPYWGNNYYPAAYYGYNWLDGYWGGGYYNGY